MQRTFLAAVVFSFAAAANLVAVEPPRSDEHVHWTPQRNVKGAIQAEMDRFEKDLKTRLGSEALASRPYQAQENDPNAARLAAITIEQIL